jgi:hypothetical protein
MKKFKIELTFIRDVIGSQPASSDIRQKYIVAKMTTGRTGMSAEVAMNKVKDEIDNLKKDEDYQEKIEEMGERAVTVFHRNSQGEPSISDVQLRGFFKDAFTFVGKDLKVISKKDGSNYSGEEKYRDWIGDRISFTEQYIPLKGDIRIFDRPIRVNTMQGPRVSIASSETMTPKAPIEFTVVTTDDVEKKYVEAILDRGIFKGLGSWANAQWGSFQYELKEL